MLDEESPIDYCICRSNQLRSCLIRVVGECETELSKVFSRDEVARRILKVSHSNDPIARALTLQLLGCLAPLLSDNKLARGTQLNMKTTRG